MRAYKFLNSDGCSLLTGHRWPLPQGTVPGSWIDVGAVRPCHQGVHACRPEDLPYWLDTDLWEIDLAGEIVEADHKVAAQRGRIVGRIDAWSTVQSEFSEMSVWRTRDFAITAVTAEGRNDLAERLQSAVTLDQLTEFWDVAQEFDVDSPMGRAVGYVADGAEMAMTDEPSPAPFVAAVAAGFAAMYAKGDEASFHTAFATERSYQATWLACRLALK